MAVAYQTSASAHTGAGGNLTITKPVGLAVGDLLVGCFYINQSQGMSVRSGWTQVSPSTHGSRCFVQWKIADAADVAATNFAFTGGNGTGLAGGLSRISGTDLLNPIDQSIDNNSFSNNFSTSGSITPSRANSLFMLFIGAFDVSGAIAITGFGIGTDNPTWTNPYSEDVGGGPPACSLAYGSRPQTTASGSGIASMGANSGNEMSGILFNILPPSTFVPGSPSRPMTGAVRRAAYY